jgi:D-aspartate ligase
VIPAVVLQASGPNALGIVRSLGRAGIPVIACDHDPEALGLLSRYAHAQVLPDPLADAGRFVDALLDLGERLPDGGVLFATHDEALSAIGPREVEVDRLFRRPWSPWARMEGILDKAVQHAAARAIGFPVPATVEVASEGDLAAAAAELRFPVVIKPRNAPEFRRRFRRQLFEARNAEELRRLWADAAPYEPQVSEAIPGADDTLWTLGSYRDAQGVPLASFTGRKLRQWPTGYGTARSAEARWDPDLAARCHALLDELRFHGISQVEVKRDARDGRDYLIEVNPRSWLWIALATACGVNLPEVCHRDAIGSPRALGTGHAGNRRWALLAKHVVAGAREVRAGAWSARRFAASLRPPLTDGVFDLRDPRPGVAQVRRLVGRAMGRAAER